MKVNSAIQAARFLYTILFGLCTGPLYDLLQVIQRRNRHKPLCSALWDAGFWTIVLSGFTVLILTLCGGELRIYMGVGSALGFFLYTVLRNQFRDN